jgi:hypothetical protein
MWCLEMERLPIFPIENGVIYDINHFIQVRELIEDLSVRWCGDGWIDAWIDG